MHPARSPLSSPSSSPPIEQDALAGLDTAEVAERRSRGQVNVQPDRTSRSYADIVRANVLTRFNAIIAVLAAVVLVVGSPIDALFAMVLVFNTLIGIVQEIRAKRTLDQLRVLIAPTVTVRRDGTEQSIAAGDVVLDDVIRLQPGDQVPVDGVVLESTGLEVDESSLTGESDAVAKSVDDEVLSGSAVVAGRAWIRATRVGHDARIHQLVAQAKEFVLTRSELRAGIDRILTVVMWGLPPLAALLLWSQLRASKGVADGLVSAVAGVVGLVPQGLVLLTSLAMAVAIGRLARHHVVVQELYAVEGLARIDVLCVDKTGTLTTGKFTLDAIEPLDGSDEPTVTRALEALALSDESPNSTMQVLAEALAHTVKPAGAHARTPTATVEFSSARKWSGASFSDLGTWLLGAPEILLEGAAPEAAQATRARIAELTATAKRVLLLVESATPLNGEELPSALTPCGIVILAEELRADAATTMAYFAEQHVEVKVISGDSAATVSAIATQLGVPGAEHAVDLRDHTAPFDDLVTTTTVFGRVLPEQKRELVDALQRAGHVVAMTGDGVNDIPALKRADIGIAMDTATSATKAVAQLVLLDGRFDHLPSVVAEGRRVIANMERVSSLFVTKTVYSAVFALTIGISGAVFPFLPRHMSLISEVTVGVPAFILSFRASDRPYESGYLRRVVQFAVPSGLVASIVALAAYWVSKAPYLDATLDQARTASTFALGTIALWVLSRLMRPLDRLEVALLAVLAAAFLAVFAVPWLRDLYALDLPPWRDAAVIVAVTIGSMFGLEVLLQAESRFSARRR